MKTAIIAVLLFAFFFSSHTALSQAPPVYEYAVKFVCGKGDGRILAPGVYFTAINVHNPSDTVVFFKKKFVIALPNEKPGEVSKFYDARLGPDQAMEIDCPDIKEHLHTSAPFVKGFVVIDSPFELDVVAVYSATGANGLVSTMHTERVPARRVRN